MRQGPLQRRLGLAGFVAALAPAGPVAPSVHHLPVEVAADLLEQQSARARAARAAAGDTDQGRWMEQPGPSQ